MNTTIKTGQQANATNSISPEKKLLNCLQEQSSVFEDAVLFIETLERAANRRELGDPELVARLQKCLERIVSAQTKVASANADFRESGIVAPAQLKNALARHEERLKTLILRTDALQEVFKTVRADVSSQLDTDTRRRTMQTAYQKTLKSV